MKRNRDAAPLVLPTSRPPPIKPRPDVELCKRGEVRVERILAAATEVFLENGYRKARLSDIVARAGGSMSTLYRAFGDKQGLAHAIMEDSIRAFGEGLASLQESTLPPEQALAVATDRMLEEMLAPSRIVTHRIVLAEGTEFPELRDWFITHGVQTAERSLAEYFARETTAGRLTMTSPELAAKHFFIMVFGAIIIHGSSGYIANFSHDRLRAETREALSIFLRGVLPAKRP
ncbi:MAG: TetR/AcrR family transcriptional regulator [Pseudoxanthomonas sp.]